MTKTTRERDNIASVQKKALSSFCKRLMMLLIASAVFFGMMMFIWLFPNKVKYYNL